MSNTEEERPRAHSSAKTGSSKRSQSSKKSTPTTLVELDEDKIDAPSRQTLTMLSVICAATLIMWAAGRAACNYNVPGESLTPRVVSFEARTRSAKGAGLEFAQCVSGGQFELAKQITTGKALPWLEKEMEDCGACTPRIKARPELASVATVLKANTKNAVVEVRTVGGPDKEVVRFLGLEREARKWRVFDVALSKDGIAFEESGPKKDPEPAGEPTETSTPSKTGEGTQSPAALVAPAASAAATGPAAPATGAPPSSAPAQP